ncbi:MAG: hypothetical protein HPY58_10030 [Firmicutes bacterium]|nr:hypothetical protein [Bacillota bacterium]
MANDNIIYPLKAEKFLNAALKHYEAIKGSYIYNAIVRDLWQKTDQVNAGYGQWLRQMLEVDTQTTTSRAVGSWIYAVGLVINCSAVFSQLYFLRQQLN